MPLLDAQWSRLELGIDPVRRCPASRGRCSLAATAGVRGHPWRSTVARPRLPRARSPTPGPPTRRFTPDANSSAAGRTASRSGVRARRRRRPCSTRPSTGPRTPRVRGDRHAGPALPPPGRRPRGAAADRDRRRSAQVDDRPRARGPPARRPGHDDARDRPPHGPRPGDRRPGPGGGHAEARCRLAHPGGGDPRRRDRRTERDRRVVAVRTEADARIGRPGRPRRAPRWPSTRPPTRSSWSGSRTICGASGGTSPSAFGPVARERGARPRGTPPARPPRRGDEPRRGGRVRCISPVGRRIGGWRPRAGRSASRRRPRRSWPSGGAGGVHGTDRADPMLSSRAA